MSGGALYAGRDGPAVRSTTNHTNSGSSKGTVEGPKLASAKIGLAPEANLVVPTLCLAHEEFMEEYARLVRPMRARHATAEDGEVLELRTLRFIHMPPRREKLCSPLSLDTKHPMAPWDEEYMRSEAVFGAQDDPQYASAGLPQVREAP